MKKHFYFLALMLCALVIVPSCKKEPPLKPDQALDEGLLQQAKDWHQQQLSLPLSTTPGALDLKGYTPDWNKANVVKNIDGQNVIGVPLLNSPQLYMELNVLAADGKSYGIIKHYELDKEQLTVYTDGGRLLENRFYDTKNFNDSPQFRTMYEPGFEGDGYGEGGPAIRGPIQLPTVTVTAPRTERPFDPSRHSVHFPSSPVSHGSESPHSGGGGGSSAPVVPVPTEAKPADIKNEVKDPCLKKVVDNLKNSNIVGKISDIISALDKNTKVQISVIDVLELYDKQGKSVAAQFNPKPGFVNGNFSGTITININTLLPTTKENTASAIIHEVVHAYFAYTGQNNKLPAIEHQKIATDYVQPMASFLSGLYSIPIKDATALAWTGLRDANSYINSDSFNYLGGTLNKKEVEDIYRDYITKSSGKPVCQ